MMIGLFSSISQAASISTARDQPVAGRVAAQEQPAEQVEEEAVDDVARRVPVGEMLAVVRARAPSPTQSLTVPQVQIGVRPIHSRIAAIDRDQAKAISQ